jgi:hypothetical protein
VGQASGTGVLAGSRVPTGTPPSGSCCLSRGIGVEQHEPDIFTICEDEPLSAARGASGGTAWRPGGWRTRLESVSEMHADAATFRVWTSLRAFGNEECLFSRTWTFDIPRDGG